ncbi:MAG: hypothetical protein D6695_09935 [Planctomycetota bacterium]|nr:MAG: hypothetical protein D6695_09935 [Planctomycetota bacterium]
MERLRVVLAQIRTYLGQLTPSQKMLIGSLSVIVVMTLFLVMQYSARPDMVELISEDPQAQVAASLRAAGFNVETRDGKVMIPPSQRTAAIAQLSESGNLPTNPALLFDTLGGAQDWRNSAEKDRQQYIFALQNELGRVIAQFRDVKSAKVIIHAPEQMGLGRASLEPTASVTIFTASGAPLSQGTVDAAARLVAGARAGLEVHNVEVIDGSTGRPRKPTDDGDLVSSSYLEHQAIVERETREKIEGLLSYIPGVIVAVTAEVDITKVNSQIQKNLPKGEGTISLPRRSQASSSTQAESSGAAEPGIRSNATMDVNQSASSQGSKFEQEETTDEFENAIGTEITQKVDPRGMATALAASINVPEGYVESLVRKEKGADQADAPIDRQELLDRFAEIRQQIAASVQPHLRTRGPDGTSVAGEVEVSMVPVAFDAVSSGISEAGLLGGLVGGFGSTSGLIDKIVLGALSVVALGMMLMMVKRSAKKIDLPSPEELVGVPPALAIEGDIVGEAEEGDAPMEGIEVGDEELKMQKMLEQVSELVTQNPEGAASLLGRWIQGEE